MRKNSVNHAQGRLIFKLVMCVVAIFAGVSAKADQLCYKWTAPTKDTFGNPQDPSKITGYRLFYNKLRGELETTYTDVAGTLTSHCVTGLEAGDYYVKMRTIAGSEQSADSSIITGHTSPDGTTPPSIVVEPPPVTSTTREVCVRENGVQLGCITAPSSASSPAPTKYPYIVAEIAGTWSLRIGTSNVSTGHASEDACRKAGNDRATTTATDYSCVPVGRRFTVKK